jgi:hypothetical protein
MLYSEIIAVYFQNHTKHINTLCGQNAEPNARPDVAMTRWLQRTIGQPTGVVSSLRSIRISSSLQCHSVSYKPQIQADKAVKSRHTDILLALAIWQNLKSWCYDCGT